MDYIKYDNGEIYHHHHHHHHLPPWIRSFDLFWHPALPSFPGASTISSSSRFVVEGVFRESGVVHSFKEVDPVLFVFESRLVFQRSLVLSFDPPISKAVRLCL